MSFHDDSHILSQLGILDSHEKSPKRDLPESSTAKDKQKFVDVKLTANVSDSDDEYDSDTIFDRNNLLPTAKRQNTSLVRGRSDNSSIRFLVLSLLFVAAGLVSSSNSLFTCSTRHEVIACLWICLGMFSGAYFVKFTAFRSNIMIILLSSLIVLLITLYIPFSFVILYAVRGFFVGNVLYGGFLCWFTFWRKTPRRFLIFLLFFASGSLLSILSTTNAYKEAATNMADMAVASRSIPIRIKRGVDEETEKTLLPFSVEVENSTLLKPNDELAVVKKPEVATGNVQKTKTKTEENAEKEKEIEEKQKESKNSTSKPEIETTSSSTSTTTSTTTTTTTTTTTSAPTTEATTSRAPVTVHIHPRNNKEERKTEQFDSKFPPGCPDDSILLDGPTVSRDEAATSLIRIFVVIAISIYTLSFLLCCLPCGIRADTRIKKLENESIVGLGMRLRVSIAALHTLIGFLQQLIHFHPSVDAQSKHLVACLTVFSTTLLITLIGSRTGSLTFVVNSFVLLAIGQFLRILSISSTLGIVLSIAGLLSLWISMFLTVECSLHSRSTVQLAYFLIAWIVGRTIACVFALQPVLMQVEVFFSLLVTISIGIVLFYASRLLSKSRRLKEILDNSSSPIPAGSTLMGAEYISLTAQDVMDDDEADDEDDRSSMDLDFELQQLGMEPIGIESRP